MRFPGKCIQQLNCLKIPGTAIPGIFNNFDNNNSLAKFYYCLGFLIVNVEFTSPLGVISIK